MTAGNFSLKIGTSDSSGITFNTSSIEWEVNGTEGGEVISNNWTDIWRNGTSLTTSTTFEFVHNRTDTKNESIRFLNRPFPNV